MSVELPIHDVLPALCEALAKNSCVVLVAPPGAGKTTVVPLALLAQPWADGRIIVLEPRRLAARAAAARMAWALSETVGQTVGFRVRMQSVVSAKTRIEVVTEGVFTRMILDDPALDGVCAVLFDEFHERSLDADLGLALARNSQSLLREDLRILVMSATLDGARIATLLGDAPRVESGGRQYPVETRYIGRDVRLRIEDQIVRVVLKALAETEGGLLVFLPGQGEIRRVNERLAERLTDPTVDIAPLFGALDPAAQERAISPASAGRRKVVLATSIAETSLTLDGVRVVIDCGLARVPVYNPARGLTRLETVRVSQAAADQRQGRAGRTEPGVCYRLWDELETRALPAFARPEILETDLSRLALDLARWGAKDASELTFLDQPPAAAWRDARALLQRLEALDDKGDLTGHGRAMAGLPLPPRLAHMVLAGIERGAGECASRLAVLLGEPGLGGSGVELQERLSRLGRDQSQRAKDARALAARWLRGLTGRQTPRDDQTVDEGLLIAEAFPERIAKARGAAGEYQLANGRGAYLDPTDALARERWLAVAELGGGEARDRILSAARLDEEALIEAFSDRIDVQDELQTDPAGRVSARRVRRIGRIKIDERLIEPDPALIATALMARLKADGLSSLPWSDASRRLRERAAFLSELGGDDIPDLTDAALLASAGQWLPPLLAGLTSLRQIEPGALHEILRGLLEWRRLARLDADAPEAWTAPTGTRVTIDYGAEGGPMVQVRVQELFGLSVHPAIAGGRAPLTLSLLSPARRPIQTTKDLPGFWKGSWADVRKDMRGRYPRHPWPEDPAAAQPTTRVKPRR